MRSAFPDSAPAACCRYCQLKRLVGKRWRADSRGRYVAYCSGVMIPEAVPVIDRQSSKRPCMISR